MEQDEDMELLELYKTVMAAIKEEPKDHLDKDTPAVPAPCAALQFYCDINPDVKDEITIEENHISWDDSDSAVAGWDESASSEDVTNNKLGSGRRLAGGWWQASRDCLSGRSESRVSCPTLSTGDAQYIRPSEHADGKYVLSTGHSHVSTNRREQPFASTICKSVLCDNSNLEKHLHTQRGEKPFVCTICTFRFRERYCLRRHMLTHTGEKNYACTVCEARFKTTSCVRRHMRTHTGEKPFMCTVCDTRMSDRSNLLAHIRTHASDKQFTCAVCGSVFNTVYNLNRHTRRRHTDKKSANIASSSDLSKRKHITRRKYAEHVCTICESRFCDEARLTKHVRTHVGEEPFTCVECGAKFSSSFCLKEHVCVEHSSKNLTEIVSAAGSRRRVARRGCGKLVACTACDTEPGTHTRLR